MLCTRPMQSCILLFPECRCSTQRSLSHSCQDTGWPTRIKQPRAKENTLGAQGRFPRSRRSGNTMEGLGDPPSSALDTCFSQPNCTHHHKR